MNNIYSDYLRSITIPKFILIKNLWFEHINDLDAPITRGEIIKYAEDFDEVKMAIPHPALPEDDYKQSLFEKKLGELKKSLAVFDDSPYDISEGDPADYEIFGESYTVIWVCPPDVEEIVDYLVEKYAELRDLVAIWEYYIDRMHIYPFYSLETTSDDFYDNVCDLFEKKVNKLEEPPGDKEWDELNDYL